MRRRSLAAAALLGLSLTTLAAPGFAQAPATPGADARPLVQRDPAERQARRQARVQARADLIRRTLNLQPQQEAAFQAYQAALLQPARAPRQRRAPGAAPLTTPERLDRQQARLAERMAAFQRRADATRRFYAVLTPTQKAAFDALSVRADRGDRQGRRHRGHARHWG